MFPNVENTIHLLFVKLFSGVHLEVSGFRFQVSETDAIPNQICQFLLIDAIAYHISSFLIDAIAYQMFTF